MKRYFIILLCMFLLFFASSCATDEIMDAYVFSERFNKQSEDYNIELENITSSDYEGGKKYSMNVEKENVKDTFLITLYSDADGNIKKCNITMKNANADKNEAPDQATLLQYKWVLVAATAAYTKDSVENVEAMLTDFGVESQNFNENAGSKYKETQQFRYAYTANKIGASLNIESVRLVPATENDLTLKSD